MAKDTLLGVGVTIIVFDDMQGIIFFIGEGGRGQELPRCSDSKDF